MLSFSASLREVVARLQMGVLGMRSCAQERQVWGDPHACADEEGAVKAKGVLRRSAKGPPQADVRDGLGQPWVALVLACERVKLLCTVTGKNRMWL